MASSIASILSFALIPAAAIISGGSVAAIRTPGPLLRSGVHHVTSGLLFAVVATELLPDVMHRRLPLVTIGGFAVGVAVMLLLKCLAERMDANAVAGSNQPSSLFLALAVDVAVDGLLVGVGFAMGEKQGLLLTIALALELFFLGISAAVALTADGASRARVIKTTALLAALVLVAAGLGGAVLVQVSGAVLDGVLSFGLAALLYLVTEELLVEAHEVQDTPLLTATFFAGFLVLLVIEMLI